MCLKIFEHVDCQQLWSYECVLQWKLVDMMMPKDILDDWNPMLHLKQTHLNSHLGVQL